VSRYLWIVFLYCVTAGVYWQNGRGTGDLIYIRGIDLLVGSDPHAMANATVWMLAGISTGMLVFTRLSGRKSVDVDVDSDSDA
jgi:hypothetical protein